MSKIDVACDCGAVLKVADSRRGTEVNCPRCRQAVTWPDAEVAAAVPPELPISKPRYATIEGLSPDPLTPAQPRLISAATEWLIRVACVCVILFCGGSA